MAQFTLSKVFRFEASHVLPSHGGKCARLHGHSWVGILHVEGDSLEVEGERAGMLTDYGDIGKAAAILVETRLDHYHLNDSTGLDNPTSEELARYVYDQLKHKLPLLKAVEIRETCTSACIYRPVDVSPARIPLKDG